MNAYPDRGQASGLAPQNGRVFSWDLPFPLPPGVAAWIEFAAIVALALLGLAGLLFALRKAWRAAKKASTEDILTVVAASIATGVSAQGMWQFAGDVLGFDGPLRLLLFAFIEVAVITSAVRARRNMRENYAAGIDGLAVWVLTCLSAVLSAMDAASVAEAIFRLAAPLVAAWLWDRGMAIERIKLTGRSRINWRITPERVMVKLGLAEAKDRTATDVDMHRRLTEVALAAKRVHQLRETGAKPHTIAKAVARRDRALDRATEHTDLASAETTRARLLDIATTLGGGEDLTNILATAAAPWEHDDHPAITGRRALSETRELAAELRGWSEEIRNAKNGDAEVHAAITSMAAYIAGEHVIPPSPEVREWMTFQTAALPTADVTADVTEPAGSSDMESEESSDDDADDDPRPGQDNQAVEEWIRRRCRGTRGVGERPKPADIRARYGRSAGWAQKRLNAVVDRMKEQGYTFEDAGTVLSPRRTVRLTDESAGSSVNANGAAR